MRQLSHWVRLLLFCMQGNEATIGKERGKGLVNRMKKRDKMFVGYRIIRTFAPIFRRG